MSEFSQAPRVIIVEPTPGQTTYTASPAPGLPPAAPAPPAAARSWLRTELGWGLSMFGKVLLSVAIHRFLRRIWSSGYSSPGAYENASTLSQMGRVRRGYTAPRSPIFGSGTTGSATPGTASTTARSAPSQAAPASVPDGEEWPYIATVDGYELYNTGKVLEPTVQRWPCPLRYRNPCDDCFMGVEDQNGELHCAARIKLGQILNDKDDGKTFQEIREDIRDHK